jgi:hypothetical protein
MNAVAFLDISSQNKPARARPARAERDFPLVASEIGRARRTMSERV